MKKVLNTNQVDRTAAYLQYATGQNVSAWDSSTTYVQGDMTQNPDNSLWRCILGNTNEQPPNVGFWAPVDQHGERNVIMRDLYFIGPPVFYSSFASGTTEDSNYGAYPLVDSDAPVSYQSYPTVPGQNANPVITYIPFSVEKDKLDYKTGFEASTVSLTLRPRDPNPQTDVVQNYPSQWKRGTETQSHQTTPSFSESALTLPPYSDPFTHVGSPVSGDFLYQTMRQSFAQNQDWYLAPVTIFRTFSPADSPGDVTSYGAAVMFRGRVNSITVDKEDVKLSVSSLMEIFQQKVPSQTIQPGNRWAPFNLTSPDYFAINNIVPRPGGYNYVQLNFNATVINDGDLAEGKALIELGTVGTFWRAVYTNVGSFQDTNPASPTYLDYFSTIIFLENLPVSLDIMEVSAHLWVTGDTATNPTGPGSGFPRVPQPLTGVT